MSVDQILKVIGVATPMVLFLVGALITYGKLKAVIENQNNNILRADKLVTELEVKIVSIKDKLQTFVTKTDCEKESGRCRDAICRQIETTNKNVESVKTLVIDLHEKQAQRIENLDQKRESARDEYKDSIQKLSILIAKLDQTVQNGKLYKQSSQ